MVQKHGAMLKSPNGFPIQSPYLSHLNKQIENMMRIASEFGFTPASRSRIFSFDQKNSLLLDNGGATDSDILHWRESRPFSLNVTKEEVAVPSPSKKE